jgi:hypothetical protein
MCFGTQAFIEVTRGRGPARAADIEQWLERIVLTFRFAISMQRALESGLS